MTGNDLAFAGAVIVSVFALVDPIGTLPFYAALTQGFAEADRAFVRDRAVLVAGAILTTFAVAGRFLFAAFGFSLAAFQIAGGVLVFLVGYEMIQGKVGTSRLSEADQADALARREEISVVPLGIPLLAGPGAISTVMIYEGTAGSDPWAILATFIAIGVTVAATWIILRYGVKILHRMGRVGVMAIARVMGLLLAAVGVQFVLNGLHSISPML
jgi:multiple antibiotic resistance protein